MPMTRPRTWAASSEKRRRRWYSTLHQPPDLARRFRAAFNRRGGLASRGNLVVRGSRLELVHALLEFANPFAHRAGNLRNPFGAEEEKDDDEDEEQFFDAESAEPHCASMPVGSRSDTLNLMVWAPAASRRRHGSFSAASESFCLQSRQKLCDAAESPLPSEARRARAAPHRLLSLPDAPHQHTLTENRRERREQGRVVLLGQNAQRTCVRYARTAPGDRRAHDACARLPQEGRGRAQTLARQRAAHLHPRGRAQILAGRQRRTRAHRRSRGSPVHPVQSSA